MENIEYPPGFEELLTNVREMQGTICDEECRANQENVTLYNQYETAVDNANTSHTRVKDAKRNFLIASRGYEEYSQIQQQEAESDTSFVLRELDQEFTRTYSTIKQIENSIGVQNLSENQLRDVDNVYDSQMNALTSVLDDTKNEKEIAFRKLSMVQSRYTFVEQWISWMKNVYWFLVILYVVIIFLIGQGFRNKWVWLTIGILLLYPYIVHYGIEYIPKYMSMVGEYI